MPIQQPPEVLSQSGISLTEGDGGGSCRGTSSSPEGTLRLTECCQDISSLGVEFSATLAGLGVFFFFKLDVKDCYRVDAAAVDLKPEDNFGLPAIFTAFWAANSGEAAGDGCRVLGECI